MGYITDISDATTYTVLETVPGSTIQSSSASYDLANRIPDGARVAFRWSYSSSYYTCGIDDVCVGVLSSSTPKPTGLTVSDITATSATLTWEAPANATPMSYLYHYKKASDSYYDQPIDNGQNLSVTLNGLDANTEYNFGVYANYADGSSDYAEITFTTEASCLAPTDITVSDITSTGAKLAWTPGGNETSWQYITVAHGDTPDWTSGTVMTSYTHTNNWKKSTSYHHTGAGSAYSDYYGPIYLMMPDIQISSEVDGAQLSFWSYNTYVSSYDKNSVVLLNGENETELWSPESVSQSWVETTIDLSNYVGQRPSAKRTATA